MDAVTTSRAMPAEFVGKARAFRTRMALAAEASGSVLQKIGIDVFAEFARRKRNHNFGLREDALFDLERRWRSIPPFGGISPRESLSRTFTQVAATSSSPNAEVN